VVDRSSQVGSKKKFIHKMKLENSIWFSKAMWDNRQQISKLKHKILKKQNKKRMLISCATASLLSLVIYFSCLLNNFFFFFKSFVLTIDHFQCRVHKNTKSPWRFPPFFSPSVFFFFWKCCFCCTY
jgi:hypothetical protein